MAKKVLKYYNGRLQGNKLSNENCDVLDKLRHLGNTGGYVRDIKKCIYDLPPADIEFIKESGSNDGLELHVGELTDLQTVGVAYMFYAKRIILGDSVGMGKTVEIAALFNLLKRQTEKEGFEFRFLLFTEKNLVAQTRDELIRFTGEYVDAVYGDKKNIERFLSENQDELHHSVVASHSVMKSVPFQEYLKEYYSYFSCTPFDIMVVDEAGSVLGNQKSQYYEQGKIIADMFDKVVILNATSFEKELNQFYNQLSFIDDSLLPTRTAFNSTYVEMDYRGPYPRPTGKYKNADEFKRLVGYRYFARTRKSSGATMTDCSADVLISDLSDVQKELLRKTSMPYMVYDCPSYFYPDLIEDTENTPKMKDLLRLVSEFTDNGESVLIYAIYREAQSAIQNLLFGYGIHCEIMNGETKIQEKNELIDRFKSGELKVLITNVQKGLNFGHCNRCIFYSYDTNPNKMVQFEGRMTREYNIRDKHVYLLISRGKELDRFKTMVADRAVASDMFAGSDFSCVLTLLLDENRIKQLE